MKISVCIPHYNRIDYLIYNLEQVALQSYPDIEVIVSDDCSTDDSQTRIEAFLKNFKYPLVYIRNEINLGYDRNLRRSLEMASGDYAVILGNDDALARTDSVSCIVDFLVSHDLPDVGFCNIVEGNSSGNQIRRAVSSRMLGSGPETALRYYSSFSFVGGLIFKLSSFRSCNSDKSDGSIYSQIYLAVSVILNKGRLFCIDDFLVIMDVSIGDLPRGSYKDRIARSWRDFRIVDGGLPSVIHVLIMAFQDMGFFKEHVAYRLFKKVYVNTFPYWIMNYRSHQAFPEAWGLFRGLNPWRNKDFLLLTFWSRIKVYFLYIAAGLSSLLLPVLFLKFLADRFYSIVKK